MQEVQVVPLVEQLTQGEVHRGQLVPESHRPVLQERQWLVVPVQAEHPAVQMQEDPLSTNPLTQERQEYTEPLHLTQSPAQGSQVDDIESKT